MSPDSEAVIGVSLQPIYNHAGPSETDSTGGERYATLAGFTHKEVAALAEDVIGEILAPTRIDGWLPRQGGLTPHKGEGNIVGCRRRTWKGKREREKELTVRSCKEACKQASKQTICKNGKKSAHPPTVF